MDQIAILQDEFGYWSTAANLSGKDWTNLIQFTPYYGYGYSVILVPLFWIFQDVTLLYKAAIAINALLLVFSYFISIWTAKRIFNFEGMLLNVISLVLILYPNNIFQVQIAWTETLLYFLFWVTFALILSYEEKPNTIKIIFIVATLIYMFMVHQRTIGIVIAGGITLILAIIIQPIGRRKKYQYVMILMLVLTLGIFLKNFLQNIQIRDFWHNSTMAAINNTGLKPTEAIDIFSEVFKNLELLIKALLGRGLYFIFLTGPIIITFLTSFLEKTFHLVTKKKNSSKDCKYFITYMFVGLSFLAVLGIGSISGMKGGRLDVPVYARYIENVIGPVLLLGIAEILRLKKIRFIVIEGIILAILGGIAVNSSIIGIEDTKYNVTSSVGLAKFFLEYEDAHKAVFYISIYAVLVVCIVSALVYFSRKWKGCFLIILVAFALFWNRMTYSARPEMTNLRAELERDFWPIVEIMDSYEDIHALYFLQNKDIDPYVTNAKYLQYLEPNYEINIIDKEMIETEDLKENTFLVVNAIDNNSYVNLDSEFILLGQTDRLCIYYIQ